MKTIKETLALRNEDIAFRTIEDVKNDWERHFDGENFESVQSDCDGIVGMHDVSAEDWEIDYFLLGCYPVIDGMFSTDCYEERVYPTANSRRLNPEWLVKRLYDPNDLFGYYNLENAEALLVEVTVIFKGDHLPFNLYREIYINQ